MRVPLAIPVLGLLLLNVLRVVMPATGRTAEPQRAADPFAFFSSAVTVSASDRVALARGHVVVRELPSKGNDVGLLSIIATTATPAQLVTLTRDIRQFKTGGIVRAVGVIGTPATARDFEGLPVDDEDLKDIRQCRPGDCGVKLTTSEIAALRAEISGKGGPWRARVPPLLQQLLAERVQRYQRGGLGALPMPDDGRHDVPPAAVFETLLKSHPYLGALQAELSAFLSAGGAPPPAVRDSYLYWSAEDTGGKLVISVTHLTIVHADTAGVPPVMVLGKQVLATHYFVGSLNLLAMCGTAEGPRYLVAINRSRVDLMTGPFRGIVRSTIERRIRGAAPGMMTGLKRRVEGVIAKN